MLRFHICHSSAQAIVSETAYPDSIRSFSLEYDLYGFDKVHKVQPNRPVPHVPRVHLHALVVGGVAAAADLPKPGDAGRDEIVVRDEVAVLLDLFLNDGARSDKAHLPANDVDDLRQFIKTCPPQEMTDTRDARIVLQLKILLPLFTSLGILRKIVFEACLGILYHGAEFIAGKHAAVLSDPLMRKEHAPRLINVDQHGNDRHDRENSDQPQNTAYEIKDSFQPAVECTTQIVVRLQQDDLLAHKADGCESSHRDPDEVWRDDDAGDKRLNTIDEPHLRFLFHAGRGDDHVAYPGGANDTLRIVKSAEDRVHRRDFIADRVIVQEAYDVVVKSRVIFKRSQYPLRREPRSDEEYRHAEKMQRAHAFAVEIAPAPKEEHREYPCHADKDTRNHLAHLREIHQQDDDEHRIDTRPKYLLHHDPKGHVAAARPHRIQEPEKDKGNDAEDIDVGDIKMRIGDGQPVPAQLIGKELRSHHGGIVYKDNEQRQEIGSIAFPQRQASHASPPLSKISQALQQKHPSEDGHTRECAAVDDAVARELCVGVHLLRHGKAGDRTGRCIDRDERHELHIPHAEGDRDREHDPRYDDETCRNRSDELR